MTEYDVIIAGGGASGMMAAISSLKSGKKVLLIEKNEKCGKKIYITGKGRCNITNDRDISEFFDFVTNNRNFMYSSFYTFDNRMLIDMLNENGLKTKVERGQRVFPVSDRASDVTKTLLKIINSFETSEILLNTKVTDLIVTDGAVRGVIAGKKKYYSKNVILSTGGKSYPSTGSDGYGYELAKKYGHKVTALNPALVQLYADEKWVHDLSGLSVRNINASLYKGKRKITEKFGEMLFTHQGLSGPVMLYLSSFIDRGENDYTVRIDFKPALDINKLDRRLLRDFEKGKNRNADKVFDYLLPKALAGKLFEKSGIKPEKKINSITREERRTLLELLKNLEVKITGTGGFPEAIITRGGIDVKDVNPSTMESRKISGLFFTGELIDVNALTGGFNLQIAFSTGYLAGMNTY